MQLSDDNIRIGSWQFERDFSRGYSPDAKDVAFTRAERALLRALADNPNRVMSREHLLDHLSGEGSDVSDRSVDFLINRLRRKLNDPARRPVFIATQYGEGYVWIAQRQRGGIDASDAQIVLGPVQGLPPSGGTAARGWALVRQLRDEIERRTGSEQKTCIAPSGAEPDTFGPDGPYVGITVNFIAAGPASCNVVLTVRRLRDGTVLMNRRLVADDFDRNVAGADAAIAGLVRDILESIWTGLTLRSIEKETPGEQPLAVSLHEAAGILAGPEPRWQESERRLRNELAANPEDFPARVMLATALHSKLFISGFDLIRDASDWYDGAREIEELVLSALPHIQGNDILLLAAAKLLWFADPKHRQLATDLAEDTFARTTAFASAFATVGHLRMWSGRSEEAIGLFDQGLTLSGGRSSHFTRYLMTLKAQALVSIGDNEAADECATEICRIDPEMIPRFNLFFAPTGAFDRDLVLDQLCGALDGAAVHRIFLFTHFMVTRHFVDTVAQRNILSRPARVLVPKFGMEVVPDFLAEVCVPRA